MKSFFLSLLTSRKFWLTCIPMIAAVVSYVRHGIDAPQLSQALTAGFGILVFSIAHEDAGPGSPTPLTATLVVPPALPSGDVAHLASAQVDDTQPVKVPSIPANTSVLR